MVGVELGDQSLTESCLGDLDGVLPRLQRALRDIPLHVQLSQIEIGLSHSAHELEDHGSPVLFPCQQVTAGRLIRPADPAPDIQFPVQVPLEIITRSRGKTGETKRRHPAKDRRIGAGAGLRKVVDSRAVQTGLKFLDACHRHHQILVLLESDADQPLEFLVAEQLPPGQICDRLSLLLCHAERLGCGNLRALVIRAHCAGCQP